MVDGAATQPFGRGNLYHLLSNPIYVGRIRHRDRSMTASIRPIIDRPLREVQRLLEGSGTCPQRRIQPAQTAICSLAFSSMKPASSCAPFMPTRRAFATATMSPGSSSMAARGADGWRLPANELEFIVEHQLTRILHDRAQLADWIRNVIAGKSCSGTGSQRDADQQR